MNLPVVNTHSLSIFYLLNSSDRLFQLLGILEYRHFDSNRSLPMKLKASDLQPQTIVDTILMKCVMFFLELDAVTMDAELGRRMTMSSREIVKPTSIAQLDR
jgi:hypothetical protein